ncbi:membrane-bound alpha-1,6- mannosyltransferase Initiation-specific [Orbilia oligospora]|uniref:Membrane-bound alpha-1,6-mannosyltransferase Initiation-specific n=1 Tax=Orbilia oligospora TaxID=2813651 RepID=A0A7C8PQN5_ORBOL|nr:membrane-bound alpha-1,6- mannosyltransferase Initiation-specific [Orbilia oligospora]KAF3195326.1 membrane-bound alpha-1,6- mannosyltransferase Initiation-specific [Orbilia oligospora]KAF3267642.1 membrane-bound alpha-1,6- mannosyltransferase Initiation-specific [Orbilia oligospora]KAF3269154.1 membrane-bound alpha-1,6- mannosyltransferase Initiation-specific [Orbilia oligospora]KAF3287946.1 membrane-bound alpha-1,6- mannosyltransferase Initiation-specific [Orbilia oligospora]
MADLRRDIFRGMYSNPIYRSPYATDKDATQKSPTPSSSSTGWLSCIRIPRRQAIIGFLNVVLFFVFIWHLPLLRNIPSRSFFPSGVSTPHTHHLPQAPLNPDFTPSIISPSTKKSRRQLLSLAKELSKTQFPKKIWQTWKTIMLPDAETFERRQTWHALNPDHEYELLTDKTALQYVIQNFNSTDPYIVHLYKNFPQRILAADLLRYLIAYKSGGLYSDIDTECKRPIENWVCQAIGNLPDVKKPDVNIVVGMELDIMDKSQYSDEWVSEAGFSQRIQFLQWTIYAKPGHEILRRMITSIQEAVRSDIEKTDKKSISALKYNDTQILDTTGPFRYTQTILEYVNDIMGRKVKLEEFSGIKEGKVFGDVLFLPVNRWSPGVGHSNAGDDDTAFMAHHFKSTWRE